LSLQTKKIILAVLTIMVLDKLQRIQDSIKKDKKQESRNLLIQKHFRKLKNSDLEDQKITMMMILKLLQSWNVEITLSRLRKGGRQTLSREGI
jgi:hypothetical protein